MSRSVQPDDEDFTRQAGTASPAKVIKAGCGIRFDEDELAEGIDFDGVERLRPDADQASSEDGPVEPHHKSAR